MTNVLSRAFLLSMIVLCACTKSGVQGTNLYSAFDGISSIQVMSPTTLKLSWNLDSKYTSYNIYQDGGVTPIKDNITFSSVLMTGLNPGTTYSFTVSGVTGTAELPIGGSLSSTTMTTFAGLTSGGVTLKSPTEASLTWSMNSALTNFKVFYKKKTDTWSLTLPAATVKGTNTSTVQGLTPGETYCFFVQANYDDATFEPTATSEAALNALAPCVRMTSQMNNLPSVTVGSVVPGEFPWFWTANGDANYKTEIYELDTDIRVASRTGNGPFRAFVKGVEGTKNYYALVSYQSSIARLPVLLSGKNTMTSSKTRTMASTGLHGPLTPPLSNGGNGLQNLGSQIVKGDFNCDGLPDIAVAMKTATIVPTSTHRSETGAVVIYYSYQPTGTCLDSSGNGVTCPVQLMTSKAPSMTATYPDPLLITFNATQDLMHLGTALQVGNFNGDCYENETQKSGNCSKLFKDEAAVNDSNTPKNLASIKSCDDLVISAEDGSFYVVYGDPLQGLVAGSGASTAGQDEFTCDPVSNTCRLGRFNAPSGYSTNKTLFASALTSGDYNNDGYDDLVVRATPASGISDLLVYRGSAQGLYPYGTTGSHQKISASVQLSSLSPAIASTDDFGTTLTSFYGSRKCVNNTPTAGLIFRSNQPPARAGYDLTRCDDLIIGAPKRGTGERGSIFSCKGTMDTTGDVQQIKGWTCQEHYPNASSSYGAIPGTVMHYGGSLLGVKNFNGYPISSANLAGTGAVPEVTGALFVGAPDSAVLDGSNSVANVGMVFGYYLGPYNASASASYTSGGIQAALGIGGHNIEAINTVACNRVSADQSVGGIGSRCNNQLLTPSPAVTGEKFGMRLGLVPVVDDPKAQESTLNFLAVAAPYRSVSRSDGAGVIANGGSVYLFKPDTSRFGKDGGLDVLSPRRMVGVETLPTGLTCSTGCTWYASGVNPFGPSVVYPGNLVDNAHFGLGGVVGAHIGLGASDGDAGDLISTAMDMNQPSPGNGAAYVFKSKGGFGPAENAPDLTLNPNLSLEGNYSFQEAKAVGDLNGDGYADVVTHIRANGVWSLVVYYGSANGLVKTSAPSLTATGVQPLLIRLGSDPLFGRGFGVAGDVNGDGFKDLIVFGTDTAYIYYGSSSGLVTTPEPALAPIGKGPLKFGINRNSQNLGFGSIDSQFLGSGLNIRIQSVTSGDFNGDGYDDVAIHIDDNMIPAAGAAGDVHFQANQTGRVLVVYGSVIGPQVNRLTGQIQFGSASEVLTEDPCTATTPAVCKPQLLGPPHTSATTRFGFALAGWRKKTGPTFAQWDRLVVSDPDADAGAGAVYVLEGGLTGLKPVVVQKLVPEGSPVVTGSPQNFGAMIDLAGDINGDQYDDIVISTLMTANPPVYVFYGSTVDNTIAFYGEGSLNAGDFWTPSIAFNDEIADPSKPRPQILHPATAASTDLFGWGISGLGDFNNDGYNDIAVNVLNGDSTLNGTIIGTGSVIIYFGTANGLKTKNVTISAYPRCYGGASPLCEPFQVFLPNAVESENTVIYPESVGDFNGDGLLDLLVGGIGRDLSLSGQRPATSAGILYPLY